MEIFFSNRNYLVPVAESRKFEDSFFAEHLYAVLPVSILILAIHLRHFYSKRSFFDEPLVRPSPKTLVFDLFSYNLVNKTRLWHNTAKPTLAA